jgi:putative membrane protein
MKYDRPVISCLGRQGECDGRCDSRPREARLFTLSDALRSWTFDPVPTTGVVLTWLLYVSAARTARAVRPQRFPGRRVALFAAGLVVVLVAVDGPPDVLSDTSFSAHMVQHLLLQTVAAPLLVLGAPLSVVLRADPPWLRRRLLTRLLRTRTVRVLTHPVTTLGAFLVVLVGTHLSPLYDLALEHERVHQVEHALYLVTALLFWWTAIGVDPAPHRLSYPARLLYLFLAMPGTAFLGVAVANAGKVMYPHYAANPPLWHWSPLHDQEVAGTLMWVAGMFTIVPALAFLLLEWLEEDARRQARLDARRSLPVSSSEPRSV